MTNNQLWNTIVADDFTLEPLPGVPSVGLSLCVCVCVFLFTHLDEQ